MSGFAKPYPPETIAAAQALSRAGLLDAEVAAQIGVARSTAALWRIQAGIVARKGRWVPFPAGTDIGGRKVGEIRTPSVRQRETVYRVRYACCGGAGELTHKDLRNREARDARCCPHCAPATRRETLHRQALGQGGAPVSAATRRAQAWELAVSGRWV